MAETATEVTAALRFALMQVLDSLSSEGILFQEEHNAMKEGVLEKDIVLIDALKKVILRKDGVAKARLSAAELFNFFVLILRWCLHGDSQGLRSLLVLLSQLASIS